MGAKTSPEMLKARKLIIAGVWPAKQRANATLTPTNAIYISKWYQDRIKEQRAALQNEATPAP